MKEKKGIFTQNQFLTVFWLTQKRITVDRYLQKSMKS